MEWHKVLFLSIATIAITQYDNFAQTYSYYSDATDDQKQKLREISSIHGSEVVALQDALVSAKWNLGQRLFDLNMKYEQVLTPGQLTSLNEGRRERTRSRTADNVEFMRQFSNFAQSVSAADYLAIYEGLPRASGERIAFIKQENETIDIGDWQFYSKPLSASESIVEQLRASLVDYRAFEPWDKTNFGEGFHPVFCVEWRSGDQTHFALVSLSGCDLLYIAPTGKTFFDFDTTTSKSFIQVAISSFRHHADVIRKLDEMKRP